MHRNGYIAVIVISVFATALWLGYADDSSVAPVKLQPDNAELVREGMSLYGEHCATCHGDRLQGQPRWRRRKSDGRLPAPPHDDTGHTWHHPDDLLVRITLHGPQSVAGADYLSDMPAYQGVLDERQVVAVLSYIKSTWPLEIRERHDAINEQASK